MTWPGRQSENALQFDIRRPDDFHLHLRDGALLRAVLPASANHFARAVVMPNLVPPLTTVAAAVAYRQRIMAQLSRRLRFNPLMTLYLTEETSPQEIHRAVAHESIAAVKLYPAGATTNSAAGVHDIVKARPALDAMEASGLPLCVHGEVTDPTVDIFDRESVFIDRVLERVRGWNPELRVVFEHITTLDAIGYVRSNYPFTAATVTVHHLVINRNHIFAGGLRPHYYCLPVAKRERHRQGLLAAATGGEPCFFLGTDSAPHPVRAKLSHCGCAGIFTAPVAIPCLAQIFEEHNALARLEAFVSGHGARFYRLPFNTGRINLRKNREPQTVAKGVAAGNDRIEIFDPGFPISWSVTETTCGDI